MNDAGKLPAYCCIAITESCFMRCRMCYKWKPGISSCIPEQPLSVQWKNFIFSLRSFVSGQFQINFAGGEPLIKKETLQLIRYAADAGFNTLLATNAFMIDRGMARKINASGLSSIVISLDSLHAKRHDYIRGRKGAFKRVMRAIACLNKYAPQIRIGICTVIMDENFGELCDIVKWGQRDERISTVGFQAITQPFSTPEDALWRDNKEYSHLWPKDTAKLNRIIGDLIEMKRNGFAKLSNPVSQLYAYKQYFNNPDNFIKKGTCHIDMQALNITPQGEIRICFYMDPIGNIKYDNIADVWFSPRAAALRERISACRKNCQAMVNCNYDEKEAYC